MTREEAIRILASSCIPGSKQTEALETLIPELAESEDERMMREFNDWLCEEIECLTNDLRDEKDRRTLNMLCYVLTKVKDWLEKQKEQKPWKVGANAYFTPEQKPAESISQPTVQGKGVYKICPRCKERMVRDDSMVYTSMPPQYRYECPKCGKMEFDTVMYDNPEMEEQKPWKVGANAYFTPEQKQEWSKEDEIMLKWIEDILLIADDDLNDKLNGKVSPITDSAYSSMKLCIAKCHNWLKSLPERFNLQPKQEWSEEDEACIRNLESIIYYDKKLPNDTRVILGKFLSNLRPQPQGTYKQVIHTIFGMLKDKDFYEIQPSHRVSLLNDIRVKCKDAIECAPILDEPSWKPGEVCYGPKGDPDPAGVWKPSDEQMKALLNAEGFLRAGLQHDSAKTIAELYEQLKKLM